MTPLEAITFLIAEVDEKMKFTRSLGEIADMEPEVREHCEKVELAISVVTAMLNTALPVVNIAALSLSIRMSCSNHPSNRSSLSVA